MRKAAVQVAREVANDYAEALGQRVERVVCISGTAEATVAEITVSATVNGVYPGS